MIRRPNCKRVLHSISRHDFQECACGTYVDGGNNYTRVGGENIDDIVVMPHVHLAGNKGVMLLED